MEQAGSGTRGKGLCKHEDTAYETLGLVQTFKVASDPWVGAEMGLRFMSMQGPGDARFPFALTGHLVMVGQEYWKTCQLFLSWSIHPCNRVTLFCGDRRQQC